MNKLFEEMAEAELDEHIVTMKAQLLAYRLRFGGGLSSTKEEKIWYQKASTALSRALYVKFPDGPPDAAPRIANLQESLTSLRAKFDAVSARLGNLLSRQPLIERNAAFVKIAQRDLPRVRYMTMMREAEAVAAEIEAKTPTATDDTIAA